MLGERQRHPTVLTWQTAGQRGVMEFDAVTMESPSFEVAVSEYPIELGANLTDHIRHKPVELNMTVHVSNSPARVNSVAGRGPGLGYMGDSAPTRDLVLQVKQPIINTPPSAQLPTSIAGVQLTQRVPVRAVVRMWEPRGQVVMRVKNVLDELRTGMYQAREYTIVSDLLGDFSGMLLRSIHTKRDGSSGSALSFELQFRQVFFATLSRRDVSHLLPKKPTKARSEPKKDAGKETPAEAPVELPDETLAHYLLGL